MKTLAASLLAILLLPFVLLMLLIALLGSALSALSPLDDGQPYVATGPIYYASQVNLTPSSQAQALHLATVRDAGFGSSDASRIDNFIRALRPHSPLVGQGAHMISVGQRWRVDPLLIAFWQLESEMATTGINSPANGGNMTWAAALEATQQYNCTPGPSSLGHHWAKCPDVPSGLSLWFDYMGTFYSTFPDLDAVVNRYNPCSDPGNIALGLPCGTSYGNLILGVIRTYAGPPVVSTSGGGYDVPEDCPPQVTVSPSVGGVVWAKTAQGKALQPGVPQIVNTVLGRTDYSIYQGWGPSDFPGEPPYTYQGRYYRLFHMGYDLNFPADAGAPLYSPDDAVATKVVFSDGNLVEVLTLPTGYRWQLLHLSRQVATGQVRKGQIVGYIGSTGNSSGPHLHLELKPPGTGRAWVPPEQWVCRLMQ